MTHGSPDKDTHLTRFVPGEAECDSETLPTVRAVCESGIFAIETDTGIVQFDPLTSVAVLYQFASYVRARRDAEHRPVDVDRTSGVRGALIRAARGALSDARQWLRKHTAPVGSFAADRVLDAGPQIPVFLDDLATALEVTSEHVREVHNLLGFRRSVLPGAETGDPKPISGS